MPDEKSTRPPLRRRGFRFFLRLVLVLMIVGVVAVIYVSTAGLPGFIKRPLLVRLEARGIKVDFSRLRWRWSEGFVVEDLVVGARGDDGPEFHSANARVKLALEQLLKPEWRVESVNVESANFSWILPPESGLAPLQVDDINGGITLSDDGAIELRRFTSRFRELQLDVNGRLLNALTLRRKPATNAPARNLEVLNRTMTKVANYLTNFEFSAVPTLRLEFVADASDWNSLEARLDVLLPDTRSTWGQSRDFQLHAEVRPASGDQAEPSGTIRLEGGALATPWGQLINWKADSLTVPVVQLPLHASNVVRFSFERLDSRWGTLEDGSMTLKASARDASRPDEIDVALDLTTRGMTAPQGTAGEFHLESESAINRTNAQPVRGTHRSSLKDLAFTNITAKSVSLEIDQAPAPADAPIPNETWGFWRFLQPHALKFMINGEAVSARGVDVDSVLLAGNWSAPTLQLTELKGALYGGDAAASISVDVPTREITAKASVGFDFHALDHVFTERFRDWFEPYQWENYPHASVSGVLQWPDWNNFKPNWREEVAPTIGISGRFDVKKAFYKGIPGDEAFSDFHFTNFVWHLPNLTIVRPEGRTVAVYDGDERTKDYVWQIAGDINPQVLKPLFKEQQQKVFLSFTNHATPHIDGTIWGRWRAHDLIGFRAEVTAPQLELRGEQTDLLTATVEYTNRFITVRSLEIQQSNRVGRAEAMGIDLPQNVMYFTNVQSGLPPYTVARAIGPVTARTVEPYVFDNPPEIQLNGTLGLKGHDPTDLRFTIAGGPFHWWRFNLENIAGDLYWRSNLLVLTNVVSDFYSGRAAGHGRFEFFPESRPTEFAYEIGLTNAQLRPLVRDVFAKTNGLEGALSGTLTLTAGRADSLDTWQGFGDMNLRDGVVWDIPLFGIFSPVFNAISPGLGQSRADQALGTYSIVNGTVISRDLQIRSKQFTMAYQGSVDFLGSVDARMQALILEESGALGPLISRALWPLTKIFEYRLSGTLSAPVAEPIHIPKFLFIALEPFKALQGVLRSVGEAVSPKPEPAPEPAKPESVEEPQKP